MTKKETKRDSIRLVLDECKKQDVTDKRQIAYILATIEWETNHTFAPVKEAYWVSEGWRKKHLRYHPYFGRGFVQITWKDNYAKFASLLGVDLVRHPDLALHPDFAAFIAVYGMKHGTFTGKKLSDYFNEHKEDYVGAREIINGRDKAHTIASIAKTYLV